MTARLTTTRTTTRSAPLIGRRPSQIRLWEAIVVPAVVLVSVLGAALLSVLALQAAAVLSAGLG